MKVIRVSTAAVQPLRVGNRTVFSGIAKQPRSGRVAVSRTGLESDEQSDPRVHGGVAKAVCAYPSEHLPFWQTVRAQAGVAAWDDAVPPGTVGENLLLQGLLETALWVGDQLVLPGCVLAVSEPRMPCFKLDASMGFRQAATLMTQSGFCGFYLGVLTEGHVEAGDSITLVPGPREVNIRDLFRSRSRRNA